MRVHSWFWIDSLIHKEKHYKSKVRHFDAPYFLLLYFGASNDAPYIADLHSFKLYLKNIELI